jgi:hypothetical protein
MFVVQLKASLWGFVRNLRLAFPLIAWLRSLSWTACISVERMTTRQWSFPNVREKRFSLADR